MRKFITFLILAALISAGYYYREDIKEFFQKPEPETEKILRKIPLQEVTVLDLTTEKPKIKLAKSGQIKAESTVAIVPQVSGIITELNAEVGDYVKRGSELAFIGNSLSTDIAAIQLESAKISRQLSEESRNLTNQLGNVNVDMAENGRQIAVNTINSFDSQIENAEDLIEFQVENTEEELEDAEDALEESEEYLEDLLKSQENEQMYAEKDNLISTLITEFSGLLDNSEAKIAQAKQAVLAAEKRVEIAEMTLDQLNLTEQSQIDQLEFAQNSAEIQANGSFSQIEAAQIGSELQNLQILSQATQIEMSEKIARTNQKYQHITSPIEGTITEILITEGNFVAPGQAIIKIEKNGQLIAETSITYEEKKLLDLDQNAEIEVGDTTIEGKIIEISPSLSSVSKKIRVKIALKENKEILPGTFAKIILPVKNEAIFIPLNSIQLSDTPFVRVLENAEIKFKTVKTGRIIGNYAEIINGLNGDEKIITSISELSEGEKVKIAQK